MLLQIWKQPCKCLYILTKCIFGSLWTWNLGSIKFCSSVVHYYKITLGAYIYNLLIKTDRGLHYVVREETWQTRIPITVPLLNITTGMSWEIISMHRIYILVFGNQHTGTYPNQTFSWGRRQTLRKTSCCEGWDVWWVNHDCVFK